MMGFFKLIKENDAEWLLAYACRESAFIPGGAADEVSYGERVGVFAHIETRHSAFVAKKEARE